MSVVGWAWHQVPDEAPVGPDVTSSVTPHCPDLTPGPSLCEGGCPPTSWLRAAFQAFQPQALRLDTNQHSGFVVVGFIYLVLESLYRGLLEIYPCKNRRTFLVGGLP